MGRRCAAIAVTLVGSMLLTSCSVIVVHVRARDHRRPSRLDYWAPVLESVVAVAEVVATVFVARAEADDPEPTCEGGFLGGEPHCGVRYGGATALGALTVLPASSAVYGWLKIHAMRNPSMVRGCPEGSEAVEQVVGCPRPTWALARDAAAAARAGDCATVKTIGAELRARNGGAIHDAEFLNDVAIQRCLSGPPAASPPLPESGM